MLRWALLFFLISLVAAALGFTDIAAGAASIAKVLFFVFLVIFVFSFVTGLSRARRRRRIVVRVQQPLR